MTPEQVKQIVLTILKSQGVKDSMLERVQTAQGMDMIPILQGGENVLLPMQWILDTIKEAIVRGIEIDTETFSTDLTHVPASLLVKGFLDKKADKDTTYTKSEVDEKMAKFSLYGPSSARPIGSPKGRQFYDESLNKPIWWNGTIWVDYNGEPADLQIIGRTSYIIAKESDAVNIKYVKPSDDELTVISDQEWLTCVDDGNGTIVATATHNEGTPRTTHVVLQCGEFTKSVLILQL